MQEEGTTATTRFQDRCLKRRTAALDGLVMFHDGTDVADANRHTHAGDRTRWLPNNSAPVAQHSAIVAFYGLPLRVDASERPTRWPSRTFPARASYWAAWRGCPSRSPARGIWPPLAEGSRGAGTAAGTNFPLT